MNVRIILKLFVAAVVTSTAVIGSNLSVSAGDIESITILGDSISSGYGLKENERNYSSYLGEYFGAKVENFAADGKTTSQLLEMIESNESVSDSIEKSDLICVSIGGNDIMDVFFDDLVGLAGNFSAPSGGSGFAISPEAIQNLVISFTSSMAPAAAEAGVNILEIADKIVEINPQARLIFQTVYNPFETDDENMKNIYSPLYTFTSIYLGTINTAIRNCSDLEYADIQNKFRGSCTVFTNIKNMDIHPNNVGHMLIAEEIVQQLKLSGENDIFLRELETMNPYGSIPEIIKNELEQLSLGKFREEVTEDTFVVPESSQEILTETNPKKNETTTSETELNKKKEKNKTDGKPYLILLSAAALLSAAIIIPSAVCLVRKKKDKKQR